MASLYREEQFIQNKHLKFPCDTADVLSMAHYMKNAYGTKTTLTSVTLRVHPSHKSHNALGKYPTIYHFVTEMCMHISVTKWCIVGYRIGALWDLCSRSHWRHMRQSKQTVQHLQG